MNWSRFVRRAIERQAREGDELLEALTDAARAASRRPSCRSSAAPAGSRRTSPSSSPARPRSAWAFTSARSSLSAPILRRLGSSCPPPSTEPPVTERILGDTTASVKPITA